MSNIDKQALRERYSEKPAPKCHICESVMTIQRASAGSVAYGCTGRIDKDGEGYKFAEGRVFADDHYARSRVTEYSPGGDPDVLALLDELEAKDKQIDDLKATAAHSNAGWTEAHRQEARAEAAEKRIAELEAREVNGRFPLPKDSSQGWKIDPEFISKIQDAIGYDEECQCWEGSPSMEMVEAVLIAAAAIKMDERG